MFEGIPKNVNACSTGAFPVESLFTYNPRNAISQNICPQTFEELFWHLEITGDDFWTWHSITLIDSRDQPLARSENSLKMLESKKVVKILPPRIDFFSSSDGEKGMQIELSVTFHRPTQNFLTTHHRKLLILRGFRCYFFFMFRSAN